MKHRSTRDVVEDLRRDGRLIEVTDEVDPHLEMAEIQRRVYARGGPGLLFSRVRGTRFPAASNLFGSLDQARYLFRDTLESVRRLIEVKLDPSVLPKHPLRYAGVPMTALRMLPRSVRSGAVQANQCQISDLPPIQSWPDDGGAFVTLPQVLSDDPTAAGESQQTRLMRANLGMYRIQLSGNQYVPDREIGLHYQIHRGIGVHHRAALDRDQPLRVCITVGGSPAMSLAAVMPLPEGLTELTFGGALSGRRIRMVRGSHAPVYADADFAIIGTIDPSRTKPEGPFGDHLGYYSLQHPFPMMSVEKVWHRDDAIWPFTVVGRPPQEDTTFGQLIHELTDPIIPTVIPGVKAVHAVDAAGVHPLLLAIGSERYMPYIQRSEPQELLTQANAILGNGQLSLAKFLWITDDPDQTLKIHDEAAFFHHMLSRVDWRRDLHFQTRTTIDTLDYSGSGFNQGSKVVIAATGPPVRTLGDTVPSDLRLPDGFRNPRVVIPGILAIEAPPCRTEEDRRQLATFASTCDSGPGLDSFPLITLVDDSQFAASHFRNWLWTTFTRSNPAIDLDGIGAGTEYKHWGCRGSLVIDARIKPHHAPPLIEDPQVTAKVDARATRGDALAKFL
ncbi:4-hydroxybenzoate decarboxylase subunit C [Rubripirellula lacrimiformis]|uniref:4-hydroxybenzoate decarboxylase subunit C n=1 Tax=Rubripirellula lacrimiformis TaxID=1930273 RepID=A0A517NIN1_9BACT|nr:UbiD family decarboxylase [Rubripirellula lacrimiformis]QDT06997.1 4-hydroxybenzoate decarboxylase subunit C [Rubripirellula lacrimiformis]